MGRDGRGRRPGSPFASPWLTASLALVVIGLVAANLLVSNLGRLPGETAAPGSPGGSGLAGASPTSSSSPSFTRPTPTAMPTFTTWVVQPGESLNTIATRFNTKARSIAWWNRGRYPNLDPESATYNPGLIEVGWTLVLIPGVTVDEEHPPTPSPGRPTPTGSSSGQPAGSPPGSALPAGALASQAAGP